MILTKTLDWTNEKLYFCQSILRALQRTLMEIMRSNFHKHVLLVVPAIARADIFASLKRVECRR